MDELKLFDSTRSDATTAAQFKAYVVGYLDSLVGKTLTEDAVLGDREQVVADLRDIISRVKLPKG